MSDAEAAGHKAALWSEAAVRLTGRTVTTGVVVVAKTTGGACKGFLKGLGLGKVLGAAHDAWAAEVARLEEKGQ